MISKLFFTILLFGSSISLFAGPDNIAPLAKVTASSEKNAEYYQKRSQGWTKLYNSDLQLLLPKDEKGNWTTLDLLSGNGWVEANAWQATWGVSQNIPRLAELMVGVSALMAIGLFSVQGTCNRYPSYEITSPVFDEITIKLNPHYYKGTEFKIKTYNNSKENRYIQKAQLNGRDHPGYRIGHDQFGAGGNLEIWLGQQPNKNWGIE
jgi:putative alpha-1,2-mannosidase